MWHTPTLFLEPFDSSPVCQPPMHRNHANCLLGVTPFPLLRPVVLPHPGFYGSHPSESQRIPGGRDAAERTFHQCANASCLRWRSHEIVLSLENTGHDRLYHPVVLSLIFDSEISNPTDAFCVGVLLSELQDSIWAETKAPCATLNIDSYRRSLQRASAQAGSAGFCARPKFPRMRKPWLGRTWSHCAPSYRQPRANLGLRCRSKPGPI